jgi:hypothetical protein
MLARISRTLRDVCGDGLSDWGPHVSRMPQPFKFRLIQRRVRYELAFEIAHYL